MQRVTPPWGCALKPGVFVGLTPHGSSVVRRKSTGTYYTYLPLGSLTKLIQYKNLCLVRANIGILPDAVSSNTPGNLLWVTSRFLG